jgi:SAM-dependent methyltransferase
MGISYRRARQELADVQRGNVEWWTDNPMTYDWSGSITASPHTVEWFQAIDRRSIQASYPYVSENHPFDRIFPPDLAGRRVLEIGCGMGLHTAELAKRGAVVTAIDLTAPAVEAARARLVLEGLNATVMQQDAERLPFEDDQFDVVWSWGVIHHSARTGRIVREISRVLRPGGETRIMVYNREALIARLVLLRHFLVGRGYRTKTPDEVLWEHTDGYFARYYTQDQVGDLFRTFFVNVRVETLGQEVDVIPLPGALRARVGAWLSEQRKREIAARRGGFLFVTASEPI